MTTLGHHASYQIRVDSLFMRVILFMGLGPVTAFGAMVPTTAGPRWGIDDNNTSTLNPSPLKKVSDIPGGQCPWINTGLTTFEGTPAGAGWSHVWASQAEEAKVEQGISILDYYAWVVTEPPVTAGNGTNYQPTLKNTNNNVNDVGGAMFNLKYDPANAAPGAHVFTDLHWVQGLFAHYDTYAAGEYQTRLDYTPGDPTPFYDDGGTAGKLAGGGGWFLDTPYKIESEAAEANPVADVQFQVVLADYDSANKKVTLYGGSWWGYNYTASDVFPEPASLTLLAAGALCVRRRLVRTETVA